MLAQIEDGIVDTIKAASAASPGLGYKIATVDSYGGEFDDQLTDTVRRFPGVWVTFAGAGKPQPKGTAKDKFLVPLTFAVMVGARSLRGERGSRRGLTVAGNVIEVGAYQMLEDIRLLLLRQDFGLAIDYLVPGAIRTLYNTRLNNQAIAVFAQEWHTRMELVLPRLPIDPTDPDWLRLGINYYLQPGDAVADAADILTLAA